MWATGKIRSGGGKGIPSTSPHVSCSAHQIMVICIYFECVSRIAGRQIWDSVSFSLFLVSDLQQFTWPTSQAGKWVPWWEHQGDDSVQMTWILGKLAGAVGEAQSEGEVPGGGPLWLGRSGKERHMAEEGPLPQGPRCCGRHRRHTRIFFY